MRSLTYETNRRISNHLISIELQQDEFIRYDGTNNTQNELSSDKKESHSG